MSNTNKAAATEKVQDLVGSAIRRLNQDFNGRIVNGFGVYADPSRHRFALAEAIKDLTSALDLMKNTDWYSSDD